MFLRDSLSDQYMAIVMVKFIRKLGMKDVALIYQVQFHLISNNKAYNSLE